MAVLLNDVSNLRFRLELTRRLDPGITRPAMLSAQASVDRFRHKPDLEHVFEPLLDMGEHSILDLDVIRLLEELERLLVGTVAQVQFQPVPPDARVMSPKPHAWERGEPDEAVRPPFALQLVGVPGGMVIEVGIDMALCLEPIGGLAVPPERDFVLFRYATTLDALRGFIIGLSEEYARFPTDPSKVDKGPAS